MPHLDFQSVVYGGLLGWMILALITTLAGNRRESFAGQASANQMTFRKPLSRRIFPAMMGLWIGVALPLMITASYTNPGHYVPLDSGSWFLFFWLEAFCLTMGGLSVYASGPNDLTFDLERHSYRYVFGWPIWPQVREGFWEDIDGVYVRGMDSPAPCYSVGIAWKGNTMRVPLLGRRPTLLGMFKGLGRLDRANYLASETAAVLGVPLVNPPFPKSPS